jgi:hypothetical protein
MENFYDVDSIKKITFNKLIYVILIPRIEDILDLKKDLWYENDDYTIFINESIQELNTLRKTHPSITLQQARKLLYQPNNIIFDKKNFE